MRWRSEGDLSSNFRATTAMKVPECDSYGAVGRMGREREREPGEERYWMKEVMMMMLWMINEWMDG